MFIVQEPPGGCTPNQAYVRSLSGILKMTQMLLSMITFVLSTAFPHGYGAGWVGTASLNGFVASTIWFFLHTFGVLPRILLNYYVELIIYSIWTFIYLIAGLVAAINGRYHSIIAVASFFSFVCAFLFGVDVYKQFIDVRSNHNARNERSSPSSSSPEPCSSPETKEQSDNASNVYNINGDRYPGSGENNDCNNYYKGNDKVFVLNNEGNDKGFVPIRNNVYSRESDDTFPAQSVGLQDGLQSGANAAVRVSVKIQPLYTSLYN